MKGGNILDAFAKKKSVGKKLKKMQIRFSILIVGIRRAMNVCAFIYYKVFGTCLQVLLIP